jgi:pyruvate dehydrogenase E2 component (dihydrolipoamide acetyltransferase)
MSEIAPALPDFSELGPVETAPLSRIQQVGARILARNWSEIPHVTHQDEADVTDLERYRAETGRRDPTAKPSSLSLYAKAVVATLVEFPKFNASVDLANARLILKKYYHLGFAIDTPNGLVVGVVRDCDRKPALEIGAEVAALAAKARARGLPYADMSGGSFTISSLGAQGGTGFSPIINAPEVAILGLSRLIERPTRGPGDEIVWRLMLPLSLSYDHRVINGADAARFCTALRERLARPEAPVA